MTSVNEQWKIEFRGLLRARPPRRSSPYFEMRFWGTLHCGRYDQNLTSGVVPDAFQFAFQFEVISSAEWVYLLLPTDRKGR